MQGCAKRARSETRASRRNSRSGRRVAPLPGEHQDHHLLVCPPRPKGVLETSTPVVLDEKVGDPCQAVGNDKCGPNPPPVPEREGENKDKPSCKCSHKMDGSRSRQAVGLHILRPKILKARFGAHAAELITRQGRSLHEGAR